jgi:glycosyltransferase involved in cell wall biosynthesis
MIRILVVVPRMTMGGAQRFILRLIRAMNALEGTPKNEIEWHLASFDLNGPLTGQIPQIVRTYDLSCRGRSAFFPLRRCIQEVDPDTVVAIQGFVGVLVALIRMTTRRFRLVVRETSLPSHKGVAQLRRLLYRWAYRRFDRVVCQSGDMRDDVCTHFRLPPGLVTVIPNGVPRPTDRSEDISVQGEPIAWPRSLPDRYIVTACRLDAVKDIPLLIRGFAIVAESDPNLGLVIVGDGTERSDLEKLAGELGLAERVVFTGQIDAPDAIIAGATATVLTSRYEGFPNVLLESLRRGVPITGVLSPGGIREIYREGFNGFFATERNPQGVADAIIATISRSWDKDELVADLYARFDLGVIAAAYCDAFLGQERVALLINSLQQGGAERVCSILASVLPRYRWRVEVILLEDVRFYPVQSETPVRIVNSDRLPRWRKMIALPRTVLRLKKTLSEGRFDTVLSFLAFPNVLNVVLRRSGGAHRTVISSRTNPARLLGEGSTGRLQRWAIQRWYPRADSHVSLTERMERTLREWNALPASSFVIPNPYDVESILQMSREETREETTSESSGSASRFRIVSVGRLIPLKRYEEIVAAVAENPGVSLTIVGSGPSDSTILDAANRLGVADRVFLAGQRTNPFPLVAAADLYVLSSETEGFPNAMVEAMVLGVPVVATDCPTGPREILAPELQPDETELPHAVYYGSHGVLVAVGDVASLAEAVRRSTNDRSLLREYAERARLRSGDFAVDGVVASYDAMLRTRK